MAQYLNLIYEDEAAWANAGQEGFDQAMKEHMAFGENHAAVLRGGNALEPTGAATSSARTPRTASPSPTGPSPRRRRRSAATTWSKPPTWTRPSPSPSRSLRHSVAWRCARYGCSIDGHTRDRGFIRCRRGRRRAPSRVGVRARRDGARHARPRPRRGVCPGRVRASPRDLGIARCACQPWRLAHHRFPAAGRGPAAP